MLIYNKVTSSRKNTVNCNDQRAINTSTESKRLGLSTVEDFGP